jgi:3-hydroxyacyl-CoA dehydrogenase
MKERTKTAAVLGAGVMGTGIAAHLAGAGIETHLLDIVPKNAGGDPKARNKLAADALQKALKSKPATFFDPDDARRITPGNLEDHLDRLSSCDLVIEAIVENLDVKRSLFERIAPKMAPAAILASNTSGLSIAKMQEVVPPDLAKRMVVMHFFNPVRYMRLLEVIPGPKTSPDTIRRATAIGERLGKGIVHGKDTPNFVANRIGVYGLMQTIRSMAEDGLTIEEVDKIVGVPMGRPKSAAFQTGDVVGIDTFVHVAQNCFDNLPGDEERSVFAMPDWVTRLVKENRLGRKSGAGFYKKVKDQILVLDIGTGEYRPEQKVRYDSIGQTKGQDDPQERLRTMVSADDRAAKFAWKVLSRSLAYSARRLGEIAQDIVQIDRAMRWGFSWDLGPFEAWDAIGVAAGVERMKKDGLDVPRWVTDMIAAGRATFYDGPASKRTYWDPTSRSAKIIAQDQGTIVLDVLRETKVVKSSFGASLIDLGDGAACIEVHTKMNAIDDDVTRMLVEGVAEAEKSFDALVIGNDGAHFGVGANLMFVWAAAQNKEFGQLDGAVRALQGAIQGLRYARIPIVAAPFQYTMGGSAEIAMAAAACEAHAETYIGLTEVGVGVIPAGGGCLRMVERWTGDVQDVEGADLLPFIGQASLNLATAKVATGAEEAKRLRFLMPTDGVTLDRARLLEHAKQRALGMARAGHRAPRPRVLKAAGLDVAKTISMRVWAMVEGGYATAHDALIARKLIHVLCGGAVGAGTELSEQHYLDLEREAFLSLCGEEKSQARMHSILMSNKPLRN